MIKNQKLLRIIWNKFWAKKNFWPPWGQGLSLWWGHACQRLSPRGQFWPWDQKITFLFKIFWNAFQKILSKIWFYQNLSFIEVVHLQFHDMNFFFMSWIFFSCWHEFFFHASMNFLKIIFLIFLIDSDPHTPFSRVLRHNYKCLVLRLDHSWCSVRP